MRRYHQHDDLEINLVLKGRLDYLFGGELCVVPEGHIALFWAAAPHRLQGPEPRLDEDICWTHLPLPTVLGWNLPSSFAHTVLAQRTVVVPIEAVGSHLVSLFETWLADRAAGAPLESQLLEANALVTRILLAHDRRPAPSLSRPGHRSAVAVMAQWISDHFRNPVGTAEVARAANLNPNYATTLFRESVGVTIGEQLVRHRVAEAQRLLITTTMTTETVGHAAGFGSSSNFYDHFVRMCDCTPGEYRARYS